MRPNREPLTAQARRPRRLLQALSISQSVREFLDRPRAGTIVATFHRSCYLELDREIIALVAPALLNGPLNIVVDIPPEASFLHPRVDATVTSTPSAVHLGAAHGVRLESAQSWNPVLTPWPRLHATVLIANLARARAVLLREALPESFAYQLPFLGNDQRPGGATSGWPRARRAMATLAAGIRESHLGSISDGARALAGLGSGLTPSGDDVLVGALLALTAWAPPAAAAIRRTLVDAAAGRSTRISEAYLRAAARGEASEAWHQLLAVLPTGAPTTFIPALRKVIAVGETSGADMLAGFLLALGAGQS